MSMFTEQNTLQINSTSVLPIYVDCIMISKAYVPFYSESLYISLYFPLSVIDGPMKKLLTSWKKKLFWIENPWRWSVSDT